MSYEEEKFPLIFRDGFIDKEDLHDMLASLGKVGTYRTYQLTYSNLLYVGSYIVPTRTTVLDVQ